MPEAADVYGTVFKNGSAILMARVVDEDGSAITQSDIDSATYTIYLVDDSDPDSQTAVTGHTDESLTVADVIYDSLQDDELWDVDATGYNFRHVIDVSENEAFAVAGRAYRVVAELTPSSGQKILVRFKLHVI